jgi:hypothetical protein
MRRQLNWPTYCLQAYRLRNYFMKTSVSLAALTLCAVLAATSAANAAVLASNNFDTENGGATALNYTGFSNLTVTGPTNATVDLIRQPNFGLTCAGGSGSCVDLDGSTRVGGTLDTAFFAFGAGDTLTLTFDLSGNQLNAPPDGFFAGFNFGGLTQVAGGHFGGGFGDITFGAGAGSGIERSDTVAGTVHSFSNYEVSFTAAQGGTAQAFVGTSSGDNIGPIVDNIVLSTSAVPEPATWAMMIIGFGLVGVAARRRGLMSVAETA